MRWLSVLLGLVVASSAVAGEITVDVTSEDGAPEVAFLDDVVTVVGRMHVFFEDVLGLDAGDDVRIRITVIESREVYLARARAAGRPNAENTDGFYSRATGGVVWRGADRTRAQQVLVHEISHDLVSRAGRRIPTWLNEGMAELFMHFRIAGNAIWVFTPDRSLQLLRAGVAGWRPSARFVLTSSAAAWAAVGPASGPRPDYDYGAPLVGFLLSSASATPTLRAMFDVAYDGLTGDEAVRVVEATYPGGLARLETDWVTWWSGRPDGVQLPIRSRSFEPPPTSACDGILMQRGNTTECVR